MVRSAHAAARRLVGASGVERRVALRIAGAVGEEARQHAVRPERPASRTQHPGSQQPDARQTFRSDELPTALLHLAVEVRCGLLKPLNHQIEGFGKFAHFVGRVDLDPLLEVSLSNPAGSSVQQLHRLQNVLPGKSNQPDQ